MIILFLINYFYERMFFLSRKVVLYISTSLDGFIADSNGSIDWIEQNITKGMEDTSYDDFYSEVDTVILGRTTYDQITKELSPNYYPYSDSKTYVITSKGNKVDGDVTFTDNDVVDLIKDLKKESGKNIFIVGGSSVINPLIENNLIDEYQIAIIPTILGTGISLFNLEKQLILTTTHVKLVNNIVYHTYIPNSTFLI